MTGRGDRLTWGARCTVCGKARFTTKRAAKSAIRKMHAQGKAGGHLNAYRCGDFWHVGNLPSVVLDGTIARSELRNRRSA